MKLVGVNNNPGTEEIGAPLKAQKDQSFEYTQKRLLRNPHQQHSTKNPKKLSETQKTLS